jgi:DeoR family glycerol-3-phosphate regulon repressor
VPALSRPEPPLLTERRHTLILERLDREGAVAIAALCEALGVSRETVRRDLAVLAGQNRLRQTRGGALSFGPGEPDIARRRAVNLAGKRAIGRAAAALVRDGMAVILDSGTTTDCVAEALAARQNLRVTTNSLTIALRLGRHNGNRVVLLGGELQGHEDATLGADAVATLARYRADIAFVGAGAIASDGTLTDFTSDGAALRGRMLAAAKIAAVVADHTKFGKVTPVRVPGFEHATHLITDRTPDKALAAKLKSRRIKLLVAR